MTARPPEINLTAIGTARRRDRTFARVPGAGLHARATAGAVEMTMIGEVGWDITPSGVNDALRTAGGDDLVITLHSPGGFIHDGVAVYNLLRGYSGHIRFEVIALAASAASLILMAGDTIAIASNAQVMVHKVWSFVIGGAKDMRDEAAVLDMLDADLVKIYAERSSMALRDVQKMLDSGDTWIPGERAIELGFADELLNGPAEPAALAAFDLSMYRNVPRELAATSSPAASVQVTSRGQLEHLLRAGGLSRAAAARVAAGGYGALAGTQTDTTTSAAAAAIRAFASNLQGD